MSTGYLPRHVDRQIADAMKAAPIVIIDGPRAVGKTTTAEQLAVSTIRLPNDLALIEADATAMLSSLERPLLIDEWQLAGTDLLWTLKQLVDADPTPGQFILTGSVEPATYGPTYPLTGRAFRVVMFPMTQAELEGKGTEPTRLQQFVSGELPQAAINGSAFSYQRMFSTGFPAARDQNDPTMFLEGYAALVSQRAGEEGRDATRLAKTLGVLGVLTGQAVPDQRIWQSADINKVTWKAYQDLLARVHLATPLPAFSSNRLKRLTAYPKRFLTDTALALALASVSPEELHQDPSVSGRYIESFVAQQLRPQVAVNGGRLSHVRTSSGEREVDILAEFRDVSIGIEVKASVRPSKTDTKHLEWLSKELNPETHLSLVVHTGTDTYPLGENTWAVPISEL